RAGLGQPAGRPAHHPRPLEAAMSGTSALWRWLQRLTLGAALLAAGAVPAFGAGGDAVREDDITLQAQYWVDASGRATVEQVAGGAAQLQSMADHRPLQLDGGALWLRFDLSGIDPARRWYLLLNGG